MQEILNVNLLSFSNQIQRFLLVAMVVYEGLLKYDIKMDRNDSGVVGKVPTFPCQPRTASQRGKARGPAQRITESGIGESSRFVALKISDKNKRSPSDHFTQR